VKHFDGSKSFGPFSVLFNAIAGLHKWSDEDKKVHLVAALEGDAAITVLGLRPDATFEQLWEHLQQKYNGETQKQQARDHTP